MPDTIRLLVDAPPTAALGALPGQEYLESAATEVVEIAAETLTEGVRRLVAQVAEMLAGTTTGGTGWEVREAKVSLGVDANGQVSLWALKGQAGAKASLDITLRRP
jgi:hypothetical protein